MITMLLASVLVLLLVQSVQLAAVQAQRVDRNFYARPGVTPAQIIRARGFQAKEYFITTPDGYVLKITRGINRKFNGGGNAGLHDRAPILFIHGVAADPTTFLINSFDVTPKDLANFDLRVNASSLANEPSAKSLPFLAMNMGHDTWFLSRRGAPGSQVKIGNPNSIRPNATSPNGSASLGNLMPSFPVPGRFSLQTFTSAPAAFANYGQTPQLLRFSFDADFWNYTYDEQVKFDIPQVIDYILKLTKRKKLCIVAHSAGGALTLMSLGEHPELAEKISVAVLWSPAHVLGNGTSTSMLSVVEPLLDVYSGSFPPAVTVLPLQAELSLLCATSLTQRTVCEPLTDIFYGPSGGQAPIYPEFISSGVLPASQTAASREFAQLIQATRLGGTIHKFDRGPGGNQAAYGRSVPPPYNASKITLRTMSIYGGGTDSLVGPRDIDGLLQQLTVPYKFTLVRAPFNHQGYFFNEEVAVLNVIPSMLDIQSLDEEHLNDIYSK